MSTRTIQVQPKTIQGNITSSDVQFAIENFVGLDGLVILQADIGETDDVIYGTFEPNTIREEAFSAKILSNVGTTVTFECTRGLIGKYPYSTGGIAYAHDAGSKIVFSNNPNLFNKFIAKDNTEVVTGDIQVPTPAGASSVVPKSYVDAADVVLQDQIDNDVIHLTGNETIGGIKAFSSSPTVPNGATGTQAANANDIAAAVSGASGTATDLVHGTAKLSVPAVSAPDPIVVGDNDPRIPTSDQTDALAGTGTPSSSNKYVTEDTLDSILKFGGTGVDGTLNITSGTTTINLGGAQVVEKNYTSINISGTGALAFSNPHANGTSIILKSQGAVTLTSSATPNIDVRNIGGAGGNAGAGSGRGGKGAGALYIEAGGALNYTGTIYAQGEDAVAHSGTGAALGSNGAGAGGTVVILSNSVVASSGTTTVSAGTASSNQGGGTGTNTGSNGIDSRGIFGIFRGGAGGNSTNSTVSTQFGIVPSLLTIDSRYIPLMPGSGGGGGGYSGGFLNGENGTGLGTSGNGVSIIGVNRFFV